jgi:hypothetical protein
MLEALLNEHFLFRTRDGQFVRAVLPQDSATDGAKGGGSTASEGRTSIGMIGRSGLGFNEEARESLNRIVRLAGWLPNHTRQWRDLHQAAGALQTAADSGVAVRDALYALEVSEQQVPASATLQLLRSTTRKLHTQLEASGLYASDPA